MKPNRLWLTLTVLLFTYSHGNSEQMAESCVELPRSEIFPPEDGQLIPLQGKIVNGRYYAPQNVFSCQADDFGEGEYLAQDVLWEDSACVGFYSPRANFKKAEIALIPGLEKESLDKKALKHAFDGFGIEILKVVDNAQGIEILNEEMIDGMFFAAISVEKMSVLKTPDGEHASSTRGYLVFQDMDKLVVLSNQKVTLPGQNHAPKQHIEYLKQEILNFRKTFEFGSIPIPFIEKRTEKASPRETK